MIATHPYRDVPAATACSGCQGCHGAKGTLEWVGLGSEWEKCTRCGGTGLEPARTELLVLQVVHLRLAIAKAACDLYVVDGDAARDILADLRWGGDL